MRFLFVLALVLVTACKDPFVPELSFKDTNFLVVEGYINVGTDVVTTIRLSRTVPTDQVLTEPLMEEDAVVLIEDDLDNVFELTAVGLGIYRSDTISLPVDRQYRIRIFTSADTEYYSEFASALQTPAIDSVSWNRVRDGVDINVATHDPEGKVQYYQWDYEEIWELRSPFMSFYRFDVPTNSLIPRPNAQIEAMHRCWRRDTPPDLKIRSIATLSSNSADLDIIRIPAFSEKLSENYTVLIKQHALTREAYDYLQIMMKNTNELGSFFDPQPSQLLGNIFVRGSNEPVIGYIGAYTTSEQRIYIRNDELPDWGFNLDCRQINISAHPDSLSKHFASNMLTPITYNEPRTMVSATWYICADCRVRKGDNNKPSFWDDVF